MGLGQHLMAGRGGRAGGEPDIAALCWPGMPSPGGQHHVPLCYFRNQLLGKRQCLSEGAATDFFFFLACFILTSLSSVSSLFWVTWKSRRFA